mmetsp:Transcript_15638/g.48409  ORF Transcript_15638/g.48409 Transcript_15638/m.48409 type:complete len:146 (+) Transcript_15638:1563-2000(+)
MRPKEASMPLAPPEAPIRYVWTQRLLESRETPATSAAVPLTPATSAAVTAASAIVRASSVRAGRAEPDDEAAIDDVMLLWWGGCGWIGDPARTAADDPARSRGATEYPRPGPRRGHEPGPYDRGVLRGFSEGIVLNQACRVCTPL